MMLVGVLMVLVVVVVMLVVMVVKVVVMIIVMLVVVNVTVGLAVANGIGIVSVLQLWLLVLVYQIPFAGCSSFGFGNDIFDNGFSLMTAYR